MPKREDEFWAGRKGPQGRALCPFCGSSNISYNKRFESWRCNKCEKSFPTPSYGPGGDFGKEARWFGKTTADIRRKESLEVAKKRIRRKRYRNTAISRELPNWVAPGIIVFLLLMFGIVIWGFWGNQIAYFFSSFSMTPQAVVSQTPPESPPAEVSTPAPTPVPPKQPIYNQEELIQYALKLINEDRSDNDLPPVTLGSNTAAQKHAEERLANRYGSHWGMDGLKPYMRYTLAGGINYEGENSFMIETYWIGGKDPFYRIDPKEMLEQAQEDLMASPGHRKNILDKWHKKVNLGIAYDEERLDLVQQFEGDYIDFSELPNISGNILSMTGQVTLGTIENVSLYYDPLPQPLSPEQLDAPPYDYAYGLGEDIGTILPPLPADYFYIDLSPTDVIAITWDIKSDGLFTIEANVSPILGERKGVYTVVVWVETGGEFVAISNYSIFIQ